MSRIEEVYIDAEKNTIVICNSTGGFCHLSWDEYSVSSIGDRSNLVHLLTSILTECPMEALRKAIPTLQVFTKEGERKE